MQKCIWYAGAILFLGLVVSTTSAQQFSSGIGAPAAGAFGSTTSTGTFLSQTMARPNMSAIMSRPSIPGPLNLFNMLPSFPNLNNTMLMRNVFGPQTGVILPKQATPPPPKKN